MLVQFLLYKIDSIDGFRGTASTVLNKIIEMTQTKKAVNQSKSRSIVAFTKSMLSKKDNINVAPEVKRKIQQKIFKDTFHKFFLMKVRMKISYEAFHKDYTIIELFLRSILLTYNNVKQSGGFPKVDPYDEILRDVLKGRADLKLVIWSKNREILEKELNYPPTTYKNLYMHFIEKEIRKICMQNSSIDIFKDFDRSSDFFESVQKTMEFYIRYRIIKVKLSLIYARIKMFTRLGLFKGVQFIICNIRMIEIAK